MVKTDTHVFLNYLFWWTVWDVSNLDRQCVLNIRLGKPQNMCFWQYLKLSQKSCRSSWLESQIINITLKKNKQKFPVLLQSWKLSASDLADLWEFPTLAFGEHLKNVWLCKIEFPFPKWLLSFMNRSNFWTGGPGLRLYGRRPPPPALIPN